MTIYKTDMAVFWNCSLCHSFHHLADLEQEKGRFL